MLILKFLLEIPYPKLALNKYLDHFFSLMNTLLKQNWIKLFSVKLIAKENEKIDIDLTLKNLIDKAQEYGYQRDNSPDVYIHAFNHLKGLFFDVKYICKNKCIPRRFIVMNGNKVDMESTIVNIQKWRILDIIKLLVRFDDIECPISSYFFAYLIHLTQLKKIAIRKNLAGRVGRFQNSLRYLFKKAIKEGSVNRIKFLLMHGANPRPIPLKQ